MANNSEFIDIQVYLKLPTKRIENKFWKISNPSSRRYGDFQELLSTPKIFSEMAHLYFDFLPNVTYTRTIFPDVYLLTLPKEKLKHLKLMKWMSYDRDPNFNKVIEKYSEIPSNKSVVILPKVPPIGKALMKRFYIEFMIEGAKGRTFIAENDSIWAELPSITTIGDESLTPTRFSELFPRKSTAKYQHSLVSLYLWDPNLKGTYSEKATQGRATPDFITYDIKEFANLVREINKERLLRKKQRLGFLNPLLYRNASMFKRLSYGKEEGNFPTTFSVWSGKRGLGKIRFKIFKKISLSLKCHHTPFLSRIKKNLSKYLWRKIF